MKIKVTYQCEPVGEINVELPYMISTLRSVGYHSFHINANVSKYEYFAQFINDDTEERIYFYPDMSFAKVHDSRISFKLLSVIKDIISLTSYDIKDGEGSEQYEEESE